MKIPVSGGWACLTHRPVSPASVTWKRVESLLLQTLRRRYCQGLYLTARAVAAPRAARGAAARKDV